MDSDVNMSSSSKNFINDLSNVLDSRIAEINDQLQKSKREILEKYKQMMDETDKNSIHMKDFFYSLQDNDFSGGIKSIENMKKFRDNLDEYLKDAGRYLEIYDKFSKENLSKIISNNKGVFSFIEFKINKSSTECLWSKTQPKQNFTLDEEGRNLTVTYSGCYELFYSSNVFKEGVNIIKLEVLCVTTTGYHSIGLVNEKYENSSHCVCCKNEPFFMLTKNGDTFNAGISSNLAEVKLVDSLEPYLFEFNINLEDVNDKKWSFKFKDIEYGPFKLIGNEFRIAAGMCNGGKVKYTFL
jgi:hypothetical protein